MGMTEQYQESPDKCATQPDYYYHFVDTQDADTDVGQVKLQPANWAPGTILLDRFRVEKLLGTGGAARVYLVKNIHTYDQLAMKVPTISFAIGSIRQRLFYREIRTWMDLPVHPNLTTCHSFKTIKDRIAIFAEFVNGPSLDERIVEQNLLDIEQIIDIAVQIAWGLDVAHKTGVVHQDIKPSNIIVDVNGNAKITDFGLSKAHEQSGIQIEIRDAINRPITNPSISRGVMTPSYCSYEQKNRTRMDYKSDMWSFALTILTLFTGPTWWDNGAEGQGIVRRYLSAAPRSPYPMIPDRLLSILTKCLEIEPSNRWKDMGEVADCLINCYSEITGSEYFRSQPVTTSKAIDTFRNQTAPLAYRSPEGWLKRAAQLDPDIAVRINPKDGRIVKSRTTELLFHLEMLEEAYRIYSIVYSRGQDDLLEDIIQLTSTLAETHVAAENPSGALSTYDRAIESLEIECRDATDTRYDMLLAGVCSRKGAVLTLMGHYAEALRFHDKAILLCETPDHHSKSRSQVLQLVGFYIAKSTTAGKAGNFQQSAQIARSAANICLRHRPLFREDDVQRILASCFNNEANALQATGRLKSALTAYEQAHTAFNRLKNQDNTRSQTKLAILGINRAWALIQVGDLDTAMTHIDRSLKILREQVRVIGRKEHRQELSIALQHQASALLQSGKPGDACQAIDQCIKIRESYYYRTGMPQLAFDLGKAYRIKGQIRSAQRKYDDALKWYDKGLSLFDIQLRLNPSHVITHSKAVCLGFRAETCLKTGDHTSVLQLTEKALEMLSYMITQQGRTEYRGDLAWINGIVAEMHFQRGEMDLAREFLNETESILRTELERTGKVFLKEQLVRVQLLRDQVT